MPKLVETIVSTKLKDLRIPITHHTTGRELFYKIVAHVGLKEIWYFGLEYTDNQDMQAWLKLNRKVLSHDIKWHGSIIRLGFHVKFYPEALDDELIQLVTQKLFFLQAKEAVLKDDIYCPTDKAVLLASLSCQAIFGDYSTIQASNNFLDREILLPQRIIDQYKLTKPDWDRRITELWKRHGEMLSEDATMAYLKIVQDLEMYGVNYFEIENKKGSNLWLGIDTFGLHIYEKENKLTPKVGFPWSEIKTLSFTNRRFTIKPIEKKSPDFVFNVSFITTNKRILALSMGNHELYMRRRRSEPVEIVQMKAEVRRERKLKREERLTLQEERKNAEMINKQLEEEARSYQKTAREAEEALRQERSNNFELEKQRIMAERKNLRYQERSRQVEREKSLMSRQLTDQENENEYLRNKFTAVNAEMQQVALEAKEARDKQQAEQEELERKREEKEKARRPVPESIESIFDRDVEHVTNNPVRGRQALMEPDEVDGVSSAEQDLQVMNNAKLPQYDRQGSVDTYIQSYLDILGKDIYPQLKETKLTTMDHIYAANVQAGRNKYKTLKRIRMGNTKQRVDQFECM